MYCTRTTIISFQRLACGAQCNSLNFPFLHRIANYFVYAWLCRIPVDPAVAAATVVEPAVVVVAAAAAAAAAAGFLTANTKISSNHVSVGFAQGLLSQVQLCTDRSRHP
jgi:hypothetical protein